MAKFPPKHFSLEKSSAILHSDASSFDAESFELFSPSKIGSDFAVSANIFDKREDNFNIL